MDAARVALDTLDARLRILLPEQYQDTYERVQPISMGSAGLQYDSAGQVAWDRIWQSFCDLAMAGGPPHKGAWLGPGAAADIEANREQYDTVTTEICRGIWMAADLLAFVDDRPGWVRVKCHSVAMAGWLTRAIVMENVAARCDGVMLFLPAAPLFRIDKEIKNVVTVIAKTSHYWLGHMTGSQRALIADLFGKMAVESPLIEPEIERQGWRGVECATVTEAVWMMRALVAYNILARREQQTLLVPIDPLHDPDGAYVESKLKLVRRLSVLRGVSAT